ncbi:hypothetical protein ACFLWR_04410 [Chloroflexota bacterium]
MVEWQITAKTIYCEPVDEEVTIIIKKDWSVQCTGYRSGNNKTAKTIDCEGLDCNRVAEYRNQLMKEEELL